MSAADGTSLRLPSGLTIQNPFAKLLAFAKEEYATYDAVTTELDSTITIHDILLSVMMNSWLMAPRGRSVYRARERIGRGLAGIPPEASLLDDHDAIPWDGIHALFNEFETIKGAKLAVATKILHRKRPKLIPIFDKVVLSYYEETHPDLRGLKMGPVAVRAMEVFRDDLLAVREGIGALASDLAERGFSLTPVRVLEALLWIECRKAEPYYSGG